MFLRIILQGMVVFEEGQGRNISKVYIEQFQGRSALLYKHNYWQCQQKIIIINID